jgi:PAS domain S-box-containing protein
MKKKPTSSAKAPELRELAGEQDHRPMMTELYRRAALQLRKTRKQSPAKTDAPRPETDPQRLLQELQIHQIELEMQNTELRQARDKLELALENYTDLYDFAPVGYFTLAANGTIRLANLTGAHLAGMERGRLVGQYFGTLICPEHRLLLADFLKEVFASDSRQSLDVELLSHGAPARTVNLKAQRLITEPGCRAVMMDISDRKRVEAATAQLAAMVNSSSDAIIGQDLNSVITSWNTGAEKIFGYTAKEIVGQPIARLIAPNRQAEEEYIARQIRLGKSVEQFETVRLTQAGQPLDVAVTVSPFWNASGKISGASKVIRDITAHKRSEDIVRVSETRYRRLFETAHDGVLLLDPATRKISDANPFMTKLLGYRHDELVGKELFEIGLLKDKAASREMFRKLKRKHEVRYEDLPLEGRDGRHQEIEVVANLYQENGHAVIQCNIRDITQRKQAEAALSFSEERYRNLFTSMDQGYCIIEVIFDKRQKPVDYRFLEVNPSFEKHTGLHDATGKQMRALAPNMEAHWFETYGQVALTGQPIRVINEAKALDGRWFDLYAFRVGGPASRKVAILFTNITDRKQAEQELAEKARLLDLSHDAIIVRDIAGKIRYWNHGAEELYGWSRQEALGEPSVDLLQTKFPVPLKQMIKELHRTNRWIGELSHVKRNGQRITVLARKTLDRDAQGRPTAVLETLTDITARKQAQAAERRVAVLAASNKKLENEIVRRRVMESSLKQSEQKQRNLLAESRAMQEQLRELSREILHTQEEERKRISRELHDVIAQTLTGINVRLATLKKEDGCSGDNIARNIARTQEIVGKSVAIVHQFARELRPAVLDDLGLIPALHSCLKDFSARTGLHVKLTAFAAVEEMDIAKRTVLFRVTQEALTNVSRHAQASRVEVTLQKQPAGVCLKVADDGKAFNVENFLRHRGGKHLGLLGMKERLDMIGGSFAIESTPGKGTTIVALIPPPPPPSSQKARRGKSR